MNISFKKMFQKTIHTYLGIIYRKIGIFFIYFIVIIIKMYNITQKRHICQNHKHYAIVCQRVL